MAGAVLFTRRDCPLCYTLRRMTRRSSRRHGVEVVEADVDADPVLRERYGDRVPVLELPGGVVIEGRATAREVEQAFAVAADAGRVPAPRAWRSRLRRVLGRRTKDRHA